MAVYNPSSGGSGGVGTVTSVDVSGGTTGITFSGGPVTTSGTITAAGTLAIANGGTGQTTANPAFNALAPTTTKGDIIARTSSVNARVGVGADGTIIKADSNSTNGLAWFEAPPTPGIISGRYLVPPIVTGLGAFTHATASAYACPVYVPKRQTFTGISFGIVTASTNLNVKVAAYVNTASAPGAKLAGTTATGGAYTVIADTTEDVAFTVPVTFDIGWYWLAIQTDQNQSIYGVNSSSLTPIVGPSGMIAAGPRILITNTYASGLPDPFGAATYTSGVGATYLGLKAQ